MIVNMYGFELGREYRLSIAEIYSLFPQMEIVYFDEKILLVDNLDEKKLKDISSKLGGTIKIINIENKKYKIQNTEDIYSEMLLSFTDERKNNYAINFYGKTKFNQKDFLLKAKKYFQKNDLSSRFVNQDFQNIKSYLVTKEKLLDHKTDFNLIFVNDYIYFGNTIFVQDIDSYTKRDFGKTRDMIVGMLPPKLSQIMINLSNGTTIYDPFCGLGTILLESTISGNEEVYGSDLSIEMVNTTIKNIEFIKNEFKNNLKKYEVLKLDAKNIGNSPILNNHKIDVIVTEGYLGEILSKLSIDVDKINKQRQNLSQIYEAFFSGLKKIGFNGNIVISFPFWEIKGKYNYFEEIYEVINRYCIILDLLPKNIDLKASRSGSLMYKRPDQTVGREIFKLKTKK
nr:hypothetical protein [Candidatus Gracilibacteria bacterium]